MPALGRTPSDRGYLSIKEVLDVLVKEFPDVTISKIRFLESRGLIHPERTPSGYRKFFDIDVDRLRWILRQQRENFLPLKVIKGRLDREQGGTVEASLFDSDLDSDDAEGEYRTTASPIATGDRRSDDDQPISLESPLITAPALPRIVPNDARDESAGERPSVAPQRVASAAEAPVDAPLPNPDRTASVSGDVTAAEGSTQEVPEIPTPTSPRHDRLVSSGATLSAGELCGASGAAPGLIAALEDFGLIFATVVGGVRSYGEDALVVARLASTFAQFGVEPRHLVMLKRAADRQAELYAQAVGPLMRQRNPEARKQAQDRLDHLVDVGSTLQAIFVKQSVRRQIGP
jgi:DNA-binding transcriptional MerR regulator